MERKKYQCKNGTEVFYNADLSGQISLFDNYHHVSGIDAADIIEFATAVIPELMPVTIYDPALFEVHEFEGQPGKVLLPKADFPPKLKTLWGVVADLTVTLLIAAAFSLAILWLVERL